MPLPEQIKVGGLTYRVITDGKEDVDIVERGHAAETDHHQLLITFVTKYDGPRRAKSLLHEVLHCVTDVTDLDRAWGDKEENYVERMTNVLFAILKDNPDLLRYWLEDV